MAAVGLTDLADSAVMMPMGVAVAVALVLLGQRRAALGWTVAVGGVWGCILLLKLVGYMLAATYPSSPLTAIDLITPSGHVASSAVVYGGLIGLLLRGPGSVSGRTLAVAGAVAVTIGITRLELSEHSLPEVVIGAGVGLAGAAVLARIAKVPVSRWVPVPVAAVVVLILFACYGDHASWEHAIQRAARQALSDVRGGA